MDIIKINGKAFSLGECDLKSKEYKIEPLTDKKFRKINNLVVPKKTLRLYVATADTKSKEKIESLLIKQKKDKKFNVKYKQNGRKIKVNVDEIEIIKGE